MNAASAGCRDGGTMSDKYQFVWQEFDLTYEDPPVPESHEKRYLTPSTSLSHVSFARQMQQLRINKRITITDLAKRCGMTPKQLSGFETGAEVPSPTCAEQIISTLEEIHS